MKRRLLILAGLWLVALPTLGDELKLKDGTRIVGTIVGFDDSSFRVKTSYGFAVVRRDEVVSILVKDSGSKAEPEKKPPADSKTTPEKPTDTATPAETSKPAAAVKPASANSTPPAAEPKTASSATSQPASKPAAAATASNAPPANPPRAPTTPETDPVKEEVSGNQYTNVTYGFHMYKPPAWQVLEGARSMLPGAITAMGTSDQRTYLIVGQGPAGKTLKADMTVAEGRLGEALENFRALEEKQMTVGGQAALERKFRGTVDEHDWSGVVVLIPRANQLFTIYGMTSADSDLVQIQENVIARVIASLEFSQP